MRKYLVMVGNTYPKARSGPNGRQHTYISGIETKLLGASGYWPTTIEDRFMLTFSILFQVGKQS
jgi:hypothetical protein